MGTVTVYKFKLWDQRRGANVTSNRAGTRAAIAKVQGKPIEKSAQEAEISSLDVDGFVALPKLSETEQASKLLERLAPAERDHLRRLYGHEIQKAPARKFVPAVLKSLEEWALVDGGESAPKLTDLGKLVAESLQPQKVS